MHGRAGPIYWLGLAARGFAMGAADVVPGVSGGTMAFILGIYEQLIEALRRFTEARFWRHLLTLRLREAVADVAWRFLAAVLGGILVAVFSLAPFLEWALENHASRLWAFFFGLVLASILTVARRLGRWRGATVVFALVGTVGAYLLVGLVPVVTPDAAWFVVSSGAIAICAMLLPGISGSFILLLLGKYQHVLAAVTERDVVTLGLFALGAALGMLAFARFLSWLLRRYHDLTVAALIGLMAGSLRKIWPWKETLATTLGRHGDVVPVVQKNVLPQLAPDTLVAVTLAATGIAVVLVLTWLEALMRKRAQAAGALR